MLSKFRLECSERATYEMQLHFRQGGHTYSFLEEQLTILALDLRKVIEAFQTIKAQPFARLHSQGTHNSSNGIRNADANEQLPVFQEPHSRRQAFPGSSDSTGLAGHENGSRPDGQGTEPEAQD
jgi:hypothetical protein